MRMLAGSDSRAFLGDRGDAISGPSGNPREIDNLVARLFGDVVDWNPNPCQWQPSHGVDTAARRLVEHAIVVQREHSESADGFRIPIEPAWRRRAGGTRSRSLGRGAGSAGVDPAAVSLVVLERSGPTR